MDVAFLIDSSGSIGFANWFKLQRLLIGLLKYINVGSEGTRVAMVAYSDDAVVIFKFNTLEGSEITLENYAGLISKMKWMKGLTYIDKGLLLAKDEIFTEEGGMRPDVVKVRVDKSGMTTGIPCSAAQCDLSHAVSSRTHSHNGCNSNHK